MGESMIWDEVLISKGGGSRSMRQRSKTVSLKWWSEGRSRVAEFEAMTSRQLEVVKLELGSFRN